MSASLLVAVATSSWIATSAPAPAPATTATRDATAAPAGTRAAKPSSRTRGSLLRAPVPPRIDGAYLGAAFYGAASLVRVNRLETTGSPFAGFGGHARFGQMVLPWLGLGLMVGGSLGARSERTMDGVRQRVGLGALAVDVTFAPLPRLPWTVRTAFGFGGGAVRQAGVSGRAGFGGAVFSGGTRYEFFPFANRFRPTRAGGFGVGPELGWIGALPAARGRPMAHVIYLGVSTTFYFGT